MSAGWQAVVYALAILLFLLAAFGVHPVRRDIGWGWVGLVLVTLVLFCAAVQAL